MLCCSSRKNQQRRPSTEQNLILIAELLEIQLQFMTCAVFHAHLQASKVDPTAWRMEVERVAPRLRITLNANAKDWRSHLEEVQTHCKVCAWFR